MSKKPKDQMIAEASRDLYENRLKFQADYMEYVMKLNEIEAKKKFDFVENVRVFLADRSMIKVLIHTALENRSWDICILHQYSTIRVTKF